MRELGTINIDNMKRQLLPLTATHVWLPRTAGMLLEQIVVAFGHCKLSKTQIWMGSLFNAELTEESMCSLEMNEVGAH